MAQMNVIELGATTAYEGPAWTGEGFVEEVANELWRGLPQSLKKITHEEIELGNEIRGILKNRERNIVVLSFKRGPMVDRASTEALVVHTKHSNGNYCYDGTKATYEDMESGCFLAFDDPEYDDTDL